MHAIDVAQDPASTPLEAPSSELPSAGDLTRSDYVEASVSTALSVGPDGANYHGRITYPDGVKIYFAMTRIDKIHFVMTRVDDRWGLFASGEALTLKLARRHDLLTGKTGAVVAEGSSASGVVHLTCEGQPVLPVPLPVAGTGMVSWGFTGEVRFQRAS